MVEKYLSDIELFHRDDITIECNTIRSYSFNGKNIKIVLIEVSCETTKEKAFFSIDTEIKENKIKIISKVINVVFERNIPMLVTIDDINLLYKLMKSYVISNEGGSSKNDIISKRVEE